MAFVVTYDEVKNSATPGEITDLNKAQVEFELKSALADARRHAPQLTTTTDPDVLDSARGIVCRAVRTLVALKPAVTSEGYPEYQYQQERPGGGSFTAAQIAELQALFAPTPTAGVYEWQHGMGHAPMGR